MSAVSPSRSTAPRRGRLVRAALALAVGAALALPAQAADPVAPGAGNAQAGQIAAASPRVRAAHAFLVQQARTIRHRALREATLALLDGRRFCVLSRVGVDRATQAELLAQLTAAGLIDPADDDRFPGGLRAGVFPPLLDEAGPCPRLPMDFDAAPGGGLHSHHGHPGGLVLHEASNLRASLALAEGYRRSHGGGTAFVIDPDLMIAAPIWHDWAKAVVLQWAADGTLAKELAFGGTPASGTATGAHHLLSLAESIARGLPPAFVITQASAHSDPTLGNEGKVVAWLRAAGILARRDPVAAGYLVPDGQGGWRLPPLRRLDDGLDLPGAGQPNLLAEYTLHHLSDGDYTFTVPAAGAAERLIAQLAPRYVVDPADVAAYHQRYRHPVFAQIGQERLLVLYGNGGLAAVQAELDALRARHGF